MKKLIMVLLVAFAAIGCSKDEVGTPDVTDTNTLKVYNYPSNTEILDGSTILFSGSAGLVDPTNALKFYFKNTSSSEMKVRMRLVSITGVPNTSGISFCYGPNVNDGVCLQGSALTIGSSYPRNNDAQIIIPANGTAGTGGANKFQNSSAPVAPATAVSYVIEAFQQDASGNEVGNKVRFTYKYQQ
ncbi:MAG: hypothetical protein RI980_506 [Bacteroidota bacterium]|jgi:hypothetical protein